MSNVLVAFFSASGETARLAKTLADTVKGDLYEIQPGVPYSSADLNWNNQASRSSVEMNDKTARPVIKNRVEDMTSYDVIFIGFPIWWYEAPRIIQTFLESYDLSGKTIVPFATSGGSGMGKTSDILRKSCPDAKVLSGKKMSAAASTGEISDWIDSLNL